MTAALDSVQDSSTSALVSCMECKACTCHVACHTLTSSTHATAVPKHIMTVEVMHLCRRCSHHCHHHLNLPTPATLRHTSAYQLQNGLLLQSYDISRRTPLRVVHVHTPTVTAAEASLTTSSTTKPFHLLPRCNQHLHSTVVSDSLLL